LITKFAPKRALSGVAHERSQDFTQETAERIAIIDGIVKYRDAFTDNRTTVFDYLLAVDSRFERRVGLPEYNRNT
jgi:hypothetical protein